MTSAAPRFRGRKAEEPQEPPIRQGRVPPHDLKAEAAVLSSCLLDREALDVVLALVEPEYFYSDAHRLVLDAFRALRSTGSPVDEVTVIAWLRSRQLVQNAGGATYLAQLLDATPAVGNVEHHARIVIEKWRTRRAIFVGQKYSADGYGDIGDSQSWLDAFESELHGIVHTQEATSAAMVRDVLTETFTELSTAAERGERVTGLATKFVDVDRKTSGLHAGDLTVVAARTSMGKSSFVRCVAVNVAASEHVQVQDDEQGYPRTEEQPGVGVAIFSLEMPKKQVAIAMACAEARVDIAKMRQGLLNHEDWAAMTSAAAALSRMPIVIDDQPRLTPLTLRARVRRIRADLERQGVKLGLVVVDYLQLMRFPGAQSREREVGECSQALKELAMEMGLPVIALAQLNRMPETRPGKNKRPFLSDLRDSGSIEMDADNIIFIYRDEYYTPDSPDKGIAELIIAKQRNGPTGTVRVRFMSHCTRFENLAAGDYEDFNGEFGG